MSRFRAVILLSTYNGSEYLQALLNSIDAQVNCRIRVIIRDDGSDIHPAKYLSFSGKGSIEDIEYLHDDLGNIGPGKSFLRLVEMAPAEYDGYFFCDQDDIWLKQKVERLCSICTKFPEPVLVCSNVTVVDEHLQGDTNFFSYTDFQLPELIYSNIFPGCGMCFNSVGLGLLRSAIPKEVYMHDWYAALLFSISGRLIVERDALTLYRQHSSNAIGAHRGRSLVFAIPRLDILNSNKFRKSYDMLSFIYRHHFLANNQADRRYLDLYFSSKSDLISRSRLLWILGKRRMSMRYRLRLILSALVNRH